MSEKIIKKDKIHKTCSGCNELKLRTEFYELRKLSSKKGRVCIYQSSKCKDCHNRYYRQVKKTRCITCNKLQYKVECKQCVSKRDKTFNENNEIVLDGDRVDKIVEFLDNVIRIKKGIIRGKNEYLSFVLNLLNHWMEITISTHQYDTLDIEEQISRMLVDLKNWRDRQWKV
jgi:hypothetical protein